MEGEGIMLKYIGIIIGLAVMIVSIYYLVKEKDDKESKRIYSIACIAGLAVVVISFLL